jgi:hypothetical protein
LLGIEFVGGHLPGVFLIDGNGDLGIVLNPLTNAGYFFVVIRPRRHGIRSPVDEHPEFRFAKPFHPGIFMFLGLRPIRWRSSSLLGRRLRRRRIRRSNTDRAKHH